MRTLIWLACGILVAVASASAASASTGSSGGANVEAFGCTWYDTNLPHTLGHIQVHADCAEGWWQHAVTEVVCGGVDPLDDEVMGGDGWIHCYQYNNS